MSERASNSLMVACLVAANRARDAGHVNNHEAVEALCGALAMAVASVAVPGHETALMEQVIDALRDGLPRAQREVTLSRTFGGVPQGRA